MNYLEAVVQINNIVEDKFCKEIIIPILENTNG